MHLFYSYTKNIHIVLAWLLKKFDCFIMYHNWRKLHLHKLLENFKRKPQRIHVKPLQTREGRVRSYPVSCYVRKFTWESKGEKITACWKNASWINIECQKTGINAILPILFLDIFLRDYDRKWKTKSYIY